MIEVRRVKKVYKNSVNVLVLRDINITINDEDYISIRGRSGSGKTTLLNLIGTLDAPTEGEIIYDNINPFKLNDDELSLFRNKNIGFVFQEFELITDLNALENVSLPLEISGIKKKEAKKRAEEILERFDIKERKKHYPSQLSGGEKQRVAVARAIINNPKILLCDEPTGELDRENAEMIVKILNELNISGVTILLVTHSEEIAAHAKKHYQLMDGFLYEEKKFY
ncbi:MAG TPA: ABC transporter ATP-binding protein [Caldisericia bacterium]|nr:ABC transporter ATP-binding protein [Caldisericia bacterium]HQL67077.1 ABC transporter ATP-binding protein [Caldisericia bacterium]HQP00520.1 ABC transporter ATP-binding protein [Caldisericia bacterium]